MPSDYETLAAVGTPSDRMVNGQPTCRMCRMFSTATVCYRCASTMVDPIPSNVLEDVTLGPDSALGHNITLVFRAQVRPHPTRWDFIASEDDDF